MKQTITKWAALILAGCLLSGCGTGTLRESLLGRKNDLVPLDAAALGRTSRDEVLQRFGAPDEINQRWFDTHESEVFYFYDYDEDFDEESGAELPRAKILACEFSKGTLNGYVFQRVGADPASGFDDDARGKLVKGTTLRSQVEGILGHPQGRSLIPTTLVLPALQGQAGGVPAAFAGGIPEGSKEVWFYNAQGLDEGLHKTRQKSLILFFDEKGTYLGNAWLQQLVSKAP